MSRAQERAAERVSGVDMEITGEKGVSNPGKGGLPSEGVSPWVSTPWAPLFPQMTTSSLTPFSANSHASHLWPRRKELDDDSLSPSP